MNDDSHGSGPVPEEHSVQQVMRVQEENLDALFALPHVFMVGTGRRQRRGVLTDEVCVVVFVDRKLPIDELGPDEAAPSEVSAADGVTAGVDVVERERFHPMGGQPEQPAENKWGITRPVQGGCGLSPEGVESIGTGSGFVRDRTDRTTALLTALHNVSEPDMTKLPTRAVIQPSGSQGGESSDKIGRVKRIVPIPVVPEKRDPPTTPVDAAIIDVVPDVGESFELVRADEISLQGKHFVYAMRWAAVGDLVWMRGMGTQAWINARVDQTENVYIEWNYKKPQEPGPSRWARLGPLFSLVTTDESFVFNEGDSGSLIFVDGKARGDEKPVIGTFAGGNGRHGLGASMPLIAKHLGVRPLQPEILFWYRIKGRTNYSDRLQYIGPRDAQWLGARGSDDPSEDDLICFLPIEDKYVIASKNLGYVWTVEQKWPGYYYYGRLGHRSPDGGDNTTFEIAMETGTPSGGDIPIRIYEPTQSYVEMLGVEGRNGDLIRWTPAGDASQHLQLESIRLLDDSEIRDLARVVPRWET